MTHKKQILGCGRCTESFGIHAYCPWLAQQYKGERTRPTHQTERGMRSPEVAGCGPLKPHGEWRGGLLPILPTQCKARPHPCALSLRTCVHEEGGRGRVALPFNALKMQYDSHFPCCSALAHGPEDDVGACAFGDEEDEDHPAWGHLVGHFLSDDGGRRLRTRYGTVIRETSGRQPSDCPVQGMLVLRAGDSPNSPIGGADIARLDRSPRSKGKRRLLLCCRARPGRHALMADFIWEPRARTTAAVV